MPSVTFSPDSAGNQNPVTLSTLSHRHGQTINDDRVADILFIVFIFISSIQFRKKAATID